MTLPEAQSYLDQHGLRPYLGGGPAGQLTPDYRDLARLHAAAVEKKAFTVLEFGVGWSTIVLADALRIHQQHWERLAVKPAHRHSHPFRIFSVDSSPRWIEVASALVPPHLRSHCEISYSEVEVGLFNGRMCHFFKTIPDVVPDFIYLDGPDPATATGSVHGMTWKNSDRPVVSGDLLVMEPTLLPGTCVLVDGRTTNVRFLQNNLQRRWKVTHDSDADVTTMELVEPPLGRINRETLAYRLGIPPS